jgi:hypothetical protein
LGFGLSVERLGAFLRSADLGVWKSGGSEDHRDSIDNWDICLEHRYSSSSLISEPEKRSVNLLGYVLAHLRVINPHRDSTDDYVQLSEQPNGIFSSFSCSKAGVRPNRFLCDSENPCCGISEKHLDVLKTWMPWIIEFADNWSMYYPLTSPCSLWKKDT